jgi:hypothetical protein
MLAIFSWRLVFGHFVLVDHQQDSHGDDIGGSQVMGHATSARPVLRFASRRVINLLPGPKRPFPESAPLS